MRYTQTVAGTFLTLVVVLSTVCLAQSVQTAPRDYAVQLARNEVPGGIVASKDALGWVRGRGPEDRTADKASFRADLNASLDAFNAAKGPFQAALEGGVVHIRGRDEPKEVAAALARETYVREAVEVGALTAVQQYVVGAMRGSEVTPGLIATGAFPGPECRIDRAVRIPEGRGTAISVLDEIVRQSPGLVWVATYNTAVRELDLKVGLLCPDGTSVKISVSP